MASAAVRLAARVPFVREAVLGPPTEVKLALDIALPGRLMLEAEASRVVAVVTGFLLVGPPDPLAAAAVRTVDAGAGLAVAARAAP